MRQIEEKTMEEEFFSFYVAKYTIWHPETRMNRDNKNEACMRKTRCFFSHTHLTVYTEKEIGRETKMTLIWAQILKKERNDGNGGQCLSKQWSLFAFHRLERVLFVSMRSSLPFHSPLLSLVIT